MIASIVWRERLYSDRGCCRDAFVETSMKYHQFGVTYSCEDDSSADTIRQDNPRAISGALPVRNGRLSGGNRAADSACPSLTPHAPFSPNDVGDE